MRTSLAIIAGAAAFAAGWITARATAQPITPQSLRISGYQYISPLLACNFNPAKIFPEDQSLSNKVNSTIASEEAKGDITQASTYFLDLANGNWSDTGENYKYYPSSLGKIPIMIAYYEAAESTSSILDQEITFPLGSPDLNTTQDIQPAHAIVPGQTYTVGELIDYMIQYSDNNAAQLLYDNADQNALRGVYDDLQIPTENDPTINTLDFITPQQIATLFRVLYNATYLSRDNSEKALDLMSQTSFTQGIVAGVPSGTFVSHKFGIVGLAPNGGPNTEHELHDCGIVYAPSHPYVLCVMTKSSAALSDQENAIAAISATVYQTATGL